MEGTSKGHAGARVIAERREAKGNDDGGSTADEARAPETFDHPAVAWNPTSSVEGRGHTADDSRAELARHLPDQWTVTNFEILGPDKTNHGGASEYRITIEHANADATVRVSPVSTFPSSRGPKLLNSHLIARTVAGETTTVADGRELLQRDHPAELFHVVVSAAEAFSERYQWFH